MAALGIPDLAFHVNGAEFHGKISFLKSGIYYGSHVTTVSETYAHEITSPEHGCGLDGLLKTRMEEGRLTGIVNGIDDSWNALIEGGKTSEQIVRQWKRRNAAEIRRTFELPESRGPLFSIVSRLVHQKGIDLSLEAAETIVASGGQLVVTGRGEPRLEDAVEKLARQYPHAVAARIGFDDAEARRLFAASDFLLMPSRFEPCGLSQMYAQRSARSPSPTARAAWSTRSRTACRGSCSPRSPARGFPEPSGGHWKRSGASAPSARCASMRWPSASTGASRPPAMPTSTPAPWRRETAAPRSTTRIRLRAAGAGPAKDEIFR